MLASAGLPGFFAFTYPGVTGEESFSLEGGSQFGVMFQ
jgi:hypothetical protein